MSESPRVSVVVISYNQEKYIKQALDGFAMQQTTFDFEVIVADDCSVDGTEAIIRDYAKKYPNIFKPILRNKNIGIQDNLLDAMKKAKGRYIALCEGDDYWIDAKKLQVQADFLDSHKDYAICFHPVRVSFENKESEEKVFPTIKKGFSIEGLLKSNFIQTNSVMYRRQNYETMPNNILPLDWYLHVYHAQFGKIGFINKVMSVYRKHPGGIWWDAHNSIDEIWKKHGIEHLALYIEFFKLYGGNPVYKKQIYLLISQMVENLVNVDRKYDENLISTALKEFPNQQELLLESQKEKITEQQELLLAKDKVIEETRHEIKEKAQIIKEKNHEIASIKSSIFWKLRNLVARLARRPVI